MTREAAAVLLERYGGMVWSLSRRLAGADAEDLFQETFAGLMRYETIIGGEAGERNLLYTLCLNVYRKDYGKRKRRAAYIAELPEDYDPPSNFNTEHEAAQKWETAAIRKAVDGLPDKYRVPVIMHYFTGWSAAEIARSAGMRESTVRSHLKRGREKLKQVLEGMI